MKKKLLHANVEYKFIKVPNFLKEFCCTFCAFSNNYANGCKSYCGNIPDSGCCNPFKEYEYYGFWKKAKPQLFIFKRVPEDYDFQWQISYDYHTAFLPYSNIIYHCFTWGYWEFYFRG